MKIVKWLAGAAVAALAVFGIVKDLIRVNTMDHKSVSYSGWLSVEGNKIVNERHEEIQLTGVSSHGVQWFGDLYTKENLEKLKNEMGISVFRVAMYTNPDDGGYVGNPEIKNKVYEIIDNVIAMDMYVVLDWHILNDNNPGTYRSEAMRFFAEVAEKYKENPNVIYEICNEPNGDTDWYNDIKPYAEEVIGVIRMYAPKALVVVGTPGWSRDMAAVASAPLEDSNVAYALHFYAGSDNKTLRDKIDNFREQGFAVFVSECGSTDFKGDGKVYDEAFGRWMDYLNENKISWIYWSFVNKDESSAMLKPEYEIGSDKNFMEYLSESGELVKKYLLAEEAKVDDKATEEILQAE